MTLLCDASPILALDLEKGLVSLDRRDLAQQVRQTEIANCTFGDDHDVGYVYFERKPYPIPSIHKEAAVVAETISVSTYDLCVDVDHEGNVFGIEYICRPDIGAELHSFNSGN